MDTIFTITAGLDVHKDTVVVSIRRRTEGRRDVVETRTFETFADSLAEMCGWLVEARVEAAGLESTGVYWKPVVRALQHQAARVVLWLVNPTHVKKVPGRKTDVSDSQWLSKLVMYGLVRPSFLPSSGQEELRVLTRHRTKIVADQIRYANRVVKQLETSGVKIASVCTDPLGKSGRAMIEALLDGQTDCEQVADLARGTLRKKIPTLRRAVAQGFTPSTALVLRQLLQRYDDLTADIAIVDKEIADLLVPNSTDVELLRGVPGIDSVAAAAILAEMGGDMSVFPSAKHLASWAGLSPGSEESAGKAKRAPTRKGDKYLRTILVQAAWGGVRKKTSYWNRTFRRLARLGPKKAIVATARAMLNALYVILRDRTAYREPTPASLPPKRRTELIKRYKGQLEALGFTVDLKPTTDGQCTNAQPST